MGFSQKKQLVVNGIPLYNNCTVRRDWNAIAPVSLIRLLRSWPAVVVEVEDCEY
jgi:hypothetical protein